MVRRIIERKLISFGFTHQDIATALGIDTSSVRNDLNKIGEVDVVFDTTDLTYAQRRDKAFNCAMLEWLSIHNVSNYAEKLNMDLEVAMGVMNALLVYLDVKHINGIVEGIISNIESLINPVDPIEYRPYRQLLMAVFGERSQKICKENFLEEFHYYLIANHIQLTRDSFPLQLACWALEHYKFSVRMPLDKSVKIAVNEVLGTLPYERGQEVLRLHFGLADGNQLTYDAIGLQYDVTGERIRQIEAKSLRQLRHPERARRLRIFLESPFNFTRRKLDEMFTPPPPPIPQIVYRESAIENVDEILARSVEELDLSIRSYNALKNNNVNTVGELVQKTEGYEEGGMLKLKNFGRRSLLEIREILESMNLCFGMKIENGVLKRQTSEVFDQ